MPDVSYVNIGGTVYALNDANAEEEITTKIPKVINPTSGNVPLIMADGSLTDSGKTLTPADIGAVAETDFTTLSAQVTTAEGNITNLQSEVNDNTQDIAALNTKATLTITYVTNNYAASADVARMVAFSKGGMLTLIGNLQITTSMPTGTGNTQIATISGWSAANNVWLTVPAQNGSGVILVTITTAGVVSIANTSGANVSGFCRFSATVPAA